MNERLARTLTPERRFILACARLQVDHASVRAAAQAVRSWDRVLEESDRHHLTPLLAGACENESCIPQSAHDRMKEARRFTLILNTVYLRDARDVLEALRASGITPVVLKGVALAEWLYRDISLRPFCDLDLLVEVRELNTAQRVLRDLGYRAEGSSHEPVWYLKHYYQLPRFTRQTGGFCIELHWDLGRRPYPFHLDVSAMRARAIHAYAAGIPVRCFDVEDQLLHLALHLAWGNGFDGHVRGLVDIAELVRRGVDWPVFERRVLEGNCAQIAAPALELASWLLQAPVPGSVLDALKKRRGSALSQMIARIGQARVLEGGQGHRTWMRLFWLERLSDRVTLLRQNFGGPGAASRVVAGARHALVPFLPRRSSR